MRLLSALSGHLGVELARANLPDLILIDLNLPDISGYDAMTMSRTDPATARIPVMALSARAIPRDAEWGIQAGFCSHVTKPLNVKEFMNALDVALSCEE